MSDILNKIIATKEIEVATAKAQKSLAVVQAEAAKASPVRDFIASICAKNSQRATSLLF